MHTIESQQSDKDLLVAFQSGDTDALQTLILRHQQRIFTGIILLVKDRAVAEDIFQDTFVKAIDMLKSDRYTESGKFLPWVSRIAHNLCIDHFRRNKKMPSISTDDGTDVFEFVRVDEETAEEKLVRVQTHAKLRQMVSALPEEQREVLMMRIYGDLSFKEIAQLTDVSINTALGRMRYALHNLRKMKTKHGITL